MTKPFYYVCKVDEYDWEICYDNGFGETVESKFYTQQEAEDAARKLNSGVDRMKIKELIEFLQQFDPEEVVYLLNGVGGGGPLPKEMIGPTTRRIGYFPNCVELPCFAIYGE